MARPDPNLQLRTLVVTDGLGRIVSTREPDPSRGPAFLFVRGDLACAWAIGEDVPEAVAVEVGRLASEEIPSTDWDRLLRHGDRYMALLGGPIRSGPAFGFPEPVESPEDVVSVADERELNHHFSGWAAGEIAAGRGPAVAVCDRGRPVSVCFCARRSDAAAEAGVETATAFRGLGYAPRVAAAWANRVRAEGLVPVYSTDWSNRASLAVARKLRLEIFAADFSVGCVP